MKRVGECKQCGACCHYLHQMTRLDDEALEFWKARGATLIPDGDQYFLLSEATCLHLKKNPDGTTYCDIWANRPEVCKKYPHPSVMYDLIKKYVGCGYDFVEDENMTEEPKKEYIYPATGKKITEEEAERIQEMGDKLTEEYGKKVKELYLEMCRKGEIGPASAIGVFRDLVQEAERTVTNLQTIDAFLHEWNRSFRENLERGYFKGADQRYIKDAIQPNAIVCVGAGPSLSDAQIDALKGWKGCVICVNKSVKRLLERGVTPTIITALHGTKTVLKSFQDDIVRENLHKSFVVLPTTIHPDVAEEILKYGDRDKVYWFHAGTPEDFVPNLDNLYQSMVELPVADTGGNVGLFNVVLSDQFETRKAVTMIGMELCEPRSTIKTTQDMLESLLMYFPEDDQEFVLNKVFKGYIQALMNWYKIVKDEGFKFDMYNSTPLGLVYCRRKDWIPYIPVEEFVQKYG